ncbi:MAG TPA: DUF2191 domain-containing protein [Lentisphaeria bacterium]|nr:MAG: hypothetical protein A2X45_25595 [Lentisphaerae bacterium GWF2_50_93]HCE45589.1 DUF2191 domain-containing protein [Lentisphaeria bacterium]
MRTTITIEDDVLQRARTVSSNLKKPFRLIINSALRLGLEQVEKPSKRKTYTTKPKPMGLKQGYEIDNIHELLDRIDEEGSR